MRVILHTGKGGVGKTTLAAATAVDLAAAGHRVLVLSTDQAHSLGDALGMRLGPTPQPVTDRLNAMEIDQLAENQRRWGLIRDQLGKMMAKSGPNLAGEEILAMPGLRELFALLGLLDQVHRAEHEVIVVDCAPTGETLSLLRYPERFARLLKTILPFERELARRAGPTFERLTEIPIPEPGFYDQVGELVDQLVILHALLTDAEQCTVRIVTTPERVPVAEARRNHTWLHLYGFHVDAVLVNRVLPPAALSGYFDPFAQVQDDCLRRIRVGFGNTPVRCIELRPDEPVGLAGLQGLARRAYGDLDPAAVLVNEPPYRVIESGDGYRLLIGLGEVRRAEVQLARSDGDLVIGWRGQQRHYALPDALAGREVAGARLVDGVLQVDFSA